MNSDKTATIRIDARLFRKARRLAKLKGMTTKAFMERAIAVICIGIEREGAAHENAVGATNRNASGKKS